MGFEIREATVKEMESEIAKQLQEAHSAEVDIYKHIMTVQIDFDSYKILAQAGNLLILAATVDDKIVGYSVNILGKHPHYMGLQYCQNDSFYLDPSLRGRGYGRSLRQTTRDKAKERGAKMMMWTAKSESLFAKILQKEGCMLEDVILSEELICQHG